MILYRPMVDGDVPAGLNLCRAAGWNQTVHDWDLFLKLSPEECRVAVNEGGEVIGTVATVRYDDHLSWIGMLLVDPTRQRQGIGIQLLRESLQVLHEESTVKLDATPAGRLIYLQLEFTDEYKLSRMETAKVPEDLLTGSARPVTVSDLPSILEVDRKVFGANRQPVLESVLKRGPQYCHLIERDQQVKGYCFGRSGHTHTHIGPVVAVDLATAKEVVAAALSQCSGLPLIIDVLHHTPAWKQWLMTLGFQEQRAFIRMFRGNNAFPGQPGKQFAILGPEFG